MKNNNTIKKQLKNCLNCFILLSIFLIVEEVFGQNPTLKPQKDLKADTLRPTVEYTAVISKSPFYNYIKEELRKIMQGKLVKGEAGENTSLPNFTLQGIIWGGQSPQAIINNTVLTVGDVIEESKIEKIDKNGVILSVKGKTFKLGASSLTQNNAAKNSEGGKDAK